MLDGEFGEGVEVAPLASSAKAGRRCAAAGPEGGQKSGPQQVSEAMKKIAVALDGRLGEGVEVAPLARQAAEHGSAVGLTSQRG